MNRHIEAALAVPFTIDENPGHAATTFPDRQGSLDAAVMDLSLIHI